ncbi:hypothetical protein MPSEU_000194300 [Mayamaea pseudoterrestris]|nr:hypothetical protein MPSEU_000194300 [Mayamaea pseudoterrestris]
MKLFCLLLAAVLPSFAFAHAYYFTSLLSGAQNGCYKSEALGNAVVTLKGLRMCVNLAYTGLSGPEMYTHLHGPAEVGIGNTGDVILVLSSEPVKTPATGDCYDITPAQKKELMKGRWYFNVHTDMCPDGEIRGQIFPVSIDH